MRNPLDVAEQIKDIVPEEHKPRFDRLIDSFSRDAIEQYGKCWSELSWLCTQLYGDEDWQTEMVAALAESEKD